MKQQLAIFSLTLTLLFLVSCAPVVMDVGMQRTDFTGQAMLNKGVALVDDVEGYVEVTFKNILPTDIILPLTGSITPLSGTDCTGDGTVSAQFLRPDGSLMQVTLATKIPPEGVFTVRWDCHSVKGHRAGEGFKADLSFDYITTNNNIARVIEGTVVAKYE